MLGVAAEVRPPGRRAEDASAMELGGEADAAALERAGLPRSSTKCLTTRAR